MVFSIVIDVAGIEVLSNKAPIALKKWIKVAFKQHGQRYQRAMQRRFGVKLVNGRNPGFDRLATRSGKLQGSIGSTIRGTQLDGLSMIFHIGNSQTEKYVHIQEFGGVIHGKPWLAVPLPAALTPTGRPRMGITRPRDVRGKPGWLLIKTKKGKLLIGRKVGVAGKIEFWWVLKPRVTIKPRLGFRKTVKGQELSEDRIKRVNAAVKRALKEAAA